MKTSTIGIIVAAAFAAYLAYRFIRGFIRYKAEQEAHRQALIEHCRKTLENAASPDPRDPDRFFRAKNDIVNRKLYKEVGTSPADLKNLCQRYEQIYEAAGIITELKSKGKVGKGVLQGLSDRLESAGIDLKYFGESAATVDELAQEACRTKAVEKWNQVQKAHAQLSDSLEAFETFMNEQSLELEDIAIDASEYRRSKLALALYAQGEPAVS